MSEPLYGEKAWYQSKGIVTALSSAAVGLLGMGLKAAKLDDMIPYVDVTLVSQIVAGGLALLAAKFRASATTKVS